MTHPPPDYVEGADQVAGYYGSWPSFHDAVMRKVEFDGEANSLTIVFTLNDMIDGDMGSHVAHLIMKWHEVEKLSLAADYTDSADNRLWEVKFSRTDDWLDTDLIPNDSLGGTIRARRIEVTYFKPID